MKEYIFIILNRLHQVGVLDYRKFIVPKKEFLNHYREKAKLVMQKQSLNTRDINLYHILFQPYLHWKEELRIHYANSSDFYYQYSLAQYDVYSYIIIEQFKEEEPKILACVYLPKYWSYLIQSWIIFKVVSKQLTQNSSYCKDPVVIDSQTSNTRIYKRFIPKIIQQKREWPHRDYIAKGRFTKVLGDTNKSGIYYPPRRKHEQDCPFVNDDIGRQECMYCSQELTMLDVHYLNFRAMSDWEFIDYLNHELPEDNEYWVGSEATQIKLYNEVMRRGIDPGILEDYHRLNMKCKVRLKNKMLIRKKRPKSR